LVEQAAMAMGLPANAFGPTYANGRPFGDLGRNTLVGPGQASIDYAILKKTRLREGVSLEFRAEFFNLFNHVNRTTPNSLLENAGGHGFADLSQLDSTPRQIRFGVKLVF